MSAYFNNADGSQAGPIFYSYENCGGNEHRLAGDEATSGHSTVDRAQWCPEVVRRLMDTSDNETDGTTTNTTTSTTTTTTSTTTTRSGQFGFSIGDKVLWKHDDPTYISKGTIGIVKGFKEVKSAEEGKEPKTYVQVEFPSGTYLMDPENLEKQPFDAVSSARPAWGGLSASVVFVFVGSYLQM